MQLAEAAAAAQCRSRARQSLLTLELIQANDDVGAVVAHANVYRRRAENAADGRGAPALAARRAS